MIVLQETVKPGSANCLVKQMGKQIHGPAQQGNAMDRMDHRRREGPPEERKRPQLCSESAGTDLCFPEEKQQEHREPFERGRV